MHDLRYAFRTLLKSPGFAAAAILTLAIAIGANTAMFSILYGVVLEPLPYRDPDRIVRFREATSPPEFFEWHAQQSVFSSMVGMTARTLNLTDPHAAAERVSANAVSHTYFTLLGVKPLAGRGFVEADDRPGAEAVAVISEGLWERRFGRSSIADLTITLDAAQYRVVGVMPATASLSRRGTDVWFPLSIAIAPFREDRNVRNVYVIARLKDGVSFEQARSAMTSRVMSGKVAASPQSGDPSTALGMTLLHDATVGDARRRLWILSAAVAAVLLIACINIAGLLLARADTRNRELAIRSSLGATRARIVRQLLTESLVIGGAGAMAGVAIAWWATRLFVSLAPSLPRATNITLSLPVLSFAILTSFLASILFGVIPAIRTSAVRPAGAITGSRGVLRATRTAGRGVLVIIEVALAVVLVTGAALLLKSFSRLMNVDLGIRAENLVTFSMKLPDAKYPGEAQAIAFYDAAMARIGELPGVRSVAIGEVHPLDQGWTSRVDIAGAPQTKDESRIRTVTPSYFETLGMNMVRGTAFTRDDRGERPGVVVINETFATRYFRDDNPIGRHILFFGTPRTIVGVVRSERFTGPQRDVEPAIYVPLAQMPMSDLTMVVRGSGDASTLIASVRDAIRTIDPDIALFDVETLDVTLGKSVATPRFQAVLITTFGAIALILAAIGLYALIAYQVQQRTNEIGVRLALGATHGQVVRMILTRAAALALAGIAAGLLGAIAVGRFLQTMLFQISATDPPTLIAIPILLAAIALAASYIPARRAMRVDPAVALRYE